MVTDQEIAEAILSLIHESNPNTFTTINGVVQELQAKLGEDLTHKVDFISNQINQLYATTYSQPPQPPSQSFPSNNRSALQQNPNFQPRTTAPPSGVGPATQIFTYSTVTADDIPKAAASGAPVDDAAVLTGTEMPKSSAPVKAKRRGGPGGLNKLCAVSPLLQVIVGQAEMPRTEIVKQLWAYIRKNNLQDPGNKRKIICNDELRVVFETDSTDMFKMNKLLAKHISPLEPTKQSAKKQKTEVAELVPRSKSAEAGPSIIISEALAKFLGVGEGEVLQSEVLRRIWEYIKVNQLEDPLNPMAILCDAKLQELFGCESISALGIPEVLARNHIIRRS